MTMALIDRLRKLWTSGTPPQAPLYRSLDAATGGRRGTGIGTFGPVNVEVGAAAEIVGRRAAHLAANNPFISNAVQNLTTYLVGTGARPTPRSVAPDARRLIASQFETWAEGADQAGRTDFWGIQATIARDLVIHGEGLALLHQGDEGLQVQALPPEHLDRSKTVMLGGGAYICSGVEFDSEGRRTAYHILPDRPSSPFATAAPAIRVPASGVLHIFHPLGPGQVRGLSWLAPAVLPASELDALQDALLTSAKVAALHAGFIKEPTDVGELDWDGETTFEPGTLSRLPPGTDVTFNAPDQLRDAPAFLRQNLQALAAGLGVPEHLLSGDLREANYSSLRAGLLPFRARMEQVQTATLVPQFLRPIWQRWVLTESLSEMLPGVPHNAGADWLFPRHPTVDPQRDMNALREAIKMGIISRRQAILEQGRNPDETLDEISADRELEIELGLVEPIEVAENAA